MTTTTQPERVLCEVTRQGERCTSLAIAEWEYEIGIYRYGEHIGTEIRTIKACIGCDSIIQGVSECKELFDIDVEFKRKSLI